MIIIYIIASGVIGGLLNRLRGGWAYDSGINITHGILRLILSLFTTCCFYLPFWLDEFFVLIDYIWFLGVWMAAFLALLGGWGSWFEIGRNENSYEHNQDWIVSELLAKWVYGRKTDPKRYNFRWRRDREFFAMGIRGLNFTIFAPLVFALHMNINLYLLVFIVPLGYIFGWCYERGFYINLKKFPKWIGGNTQLGEILSGATIMSSFIMIWSWFCLNI